ncbi:MAG TPA: hypothetical protein VLL95_14895, partial [Phnomibacter sp.]|nr:hypothetical protein [Phnomibacter sp.]
IQPLENVQRATDEARRIGFESVNFDLIYGLPRQSLRGLEKTVQDVITLLPDRIAFYSYAHVPWTSRGQRLFDERDLPSPEEKIKLYLKGRELLTAADYADIGMDHYALPNDSLYQAWRSGTLHRNFMGYTTQHTSLLVGLGVSSISDAGFAFAQNHKTLSEYYQAIEAGELAVCKGYTLSREDELFRRYILDVCCRGQLEFDPSSKEVLEEYCFPELEKLEADGLVNCNAQGLQVTATGRNFIRNIARCFDLHLLRDTVAEKGVKFSKAV